MLATLNGGSIWGGCSLHHGPVSPIILFEWRYFDDVTDPMAQTPAIEAINATVTDAIDDDGDDDSDDDVNGDDDEKHWVTIHNTQCLRNVKEAKIAMAAASTLPLVAQNSDARRQSAIHIRQLAVRERGHGEGQSNSESDSEGGRASEITSSGSHWQTGKLSKCKRWMVNVTGKAHALTSRRFFFCFFF